jgi:pyruvate dehydrogenase E1 component beta subunit
MRKLKFSEAILEGTTQLMEKDKSIIVLGEGVNDPTGMFGSTIGLHEKFGKDRVIEVPNSESGFTGMAIGAAIRGLKPIIVHQRNDFLLLAMDQIVNQAAKWSYMFNGNATCPLIIRAIVGRGWGQGAQHSQSLQSVFAHFPGLRVYFPTTPYDAKGVLATNLLNLKGPVLILEHRWSFKEIGEVPEELYEIDLAKSIVRTVGSDITIVTSSMMTALALRIQKKLQEKISIEIIDLLSIKPLDINSIVKSIEKTGHLLILDDDWKFSGISSEIISQVVENPVGMQSLRKPPVRIGWKDVPCPTSPVLENHFYPSEENVIETIFKLIEKPLNSIAKISLESQVKKFDGSF